MIFTLPKWYDLHVHFRQGESMACYIAEHIKMGCAGVLAMPNTKPPVARVQGDNSEKFWTIESYTQMIRNNGGDCFQDIIVPLYLTQDTTPEMIVKGAESKILRACKYYPPHGTTNADFGHAFENYDNNGVFKAMQETGVILNIHGEEHGLNGKIYFDKDTNAEDIFYRERLPRIIEKYPDLKIVCEHITTRTAVELVKESGANIAATITPQHLLFTVGDLVQGLKFHLYCLPLVKFEQDRQALLAAVKENNNTRFFAGTDSAPHTTKATDCGCAAGCFTGGIAPQLYAQAFDLSETIVPAFTKFLCKNGPAFYGLPPSQDTFTLEKVKNNIENITTPDGFVTPLPLGLGQREIPWRVQV